MIIYPALDLLDGTIVRLRQGRFEDCTRYEGRPADALVAFAGAGAAWAHVVDLDGARAREPRQHDLLAKLARSTPLKLQVGGGFRTRDQVEKALDAGIARIVLGSVAVSSPETVARWIDDFGPDSICLSLDVRMEEEVPVVATGGWTQSSKASLWDIAARLPNARHLLITDIGRDGMLSGPNLSLYGQAAELLPKSDIQASGGIRSLEDLEALETAGAIVGKALLEGRFTLQEALRNARA